MDTMMTVRLAGGVFWNFFSWSTQTRLELGFCREAQALASNANISRRKAERRAQKLDKELACVQSLLKQRDR